jgi:hypothetical protein
MLLLAFGAIVAVATLIALVISPAPLWSVLIVAGCVTGAVLALVVRRSAPWPRLRAGKVPESIESPVREFIVPVEPPTPRLEFEGRSDELKAIHERFKSAGKEKERLAVVCITGAPGIGKTALAIQYASRYRSSFPDGELFTHLEHDAEFDSPVHQVLGQFLAALQTPDEQIPPGLDERRSKYLKLTSRLRLLVVLDNACHPDCAERLLPGGQNSAAIITSRTAEQALPPNVLSHVLKIDLQPLSKYDSIRLFESESGLNEIESNELNDKIAGSGHPLAIRLAAIALSHRPYWPLDEMRGKETDADEEKAVNANLELIYPLLTAEERKALRCMALLENPTFAAWELAALLKTAEPDATKLADSLARVDLVRRTSVGPAGIVKFKVNEHLLPYLQDKISTDTLAEKRADGRAVLNRARADRKWQDSGILFDLNSKVWTLKESGEISAAFDLVRNAVAMAQENRRSDLEALALATMADLRLEIGNIAGAGELAEASISANPSAAPARALRCLGVFMSLQGELGPAQDRLDEALGKARHTRDLADEIRILIEQANVFALNAGKNKSLAAADQAVKLCHRHSDCARLLPSALYGKSKALAQCKSPREAMACLDQAASAVSSDQSLVRAWIDWLYSKVALELHRPKVAVEACRRSLDAFGSMSHRYGVARSRLVLAGAYASGSDDHLAEALAAVSDALETLQNCEDPFAQRDAKQLLRSLLVRRDRAGDGRPGPQAAAPPYWDLGDEFRARGLWDDLVPDQLASRLRRLRSEKPRQSTYWQRSVG